MNVEMMQFRRVGLLSLALLLTLSACATAASRGTAAYFSRRGSGGFSA